jgi:hypothetical protein
LRELAPVVIPMPAANLPVRLRHFTDRRLFASSLAALYAAWGTLIYFFADHAWWPMFLYGLIWPMSYLFERVLKYPILNAIIRDQNHPTEAELNLFDRIAGVFYIVIGACWVWLLAFGIVTLVVYVRGLGQASRSS